MKKTNLKVVETLKNTEIIYKLVDDITVLIDRFIDDTSSLNLSREFIPSDENFKKVQNGLKSLLDSPINKARGSNELLSSFNEFILFPSNDEEKETIDLICNNFEDSELNLRSTLYDIKNLNFLNTIGQSSPKNQWIYALGSKSYVNKDSDLNLVNSLCTFTVTNSGIGGYQNPRKKLLDMGYGVGHLISNSINNNYNMVREMRDNLKKIAIYILGYDTPIYNVIKDMESNDVQKMEDAINILSFETIGSQVSEFYSELKKYSQILDDYIESVKLPLSDFLNVVPIEFLDVLEKIKVVVSKKKKRLSNIQRKVITISVTQEITIEMDTTGEEQDINQMINKNFPTNYERKDRLFAKDRDFFEFPTKVNNTNLKILSVKDKTEKVA